MNYEQSCTNDCGFYEVSEHKTCFRDQFCAKQPICNGRILGCRFFDSDMTVCQSVCEHFKNCFIKININ